MTLLCQDQLRAGLSGDGWQKGPRRQPVLAACVGSHHPAQAGLIAAPHALFWSPSLLIAPQADPAPPQLRLSSLCTLILELRSRFVHVGNPSSSFWNRHTCRTFSDTCCSCLPIPGGMNTSSPQPCCTNIRAKCGEAGFQPGSVPLGKSWSCSVPQFSHPYKSLPPVVVVKEALTCLEQSKCTISISPTISLTSEHIQGREYIFPLIPQCLILCPPSTW